MRNMPDEKRKPPRSLEWLLKRFLQRDEVYEKLGDFEEAYREFLRDSGRFRASVWYLIQIIKAVPSFISNSYYGSITMFKNYLTAAFRNLTRNRTYSFLNILGLSVGIAAFLMISLYVLFELRYDRYHENADRIFKVISGDQAVTPFPLAPALMREFPEVATTTQLISPAKYLISFKNKTFFGDQWVWTDEHIFDVFAFPLAAGDKRTALRDPYSVVLTEDMARKYFGGEDPMGKTLHWTGHDLETADFVVTGVLKNIPNNSHVNGDFFASHTTVENFPSYNPDDFGWGNYWCHTFFLLREGADHRVLQDKYPEFLESMTGQKRDWNYFNKRLTDLHLRSADIIFHFRAVSDFRYIAIFSAVALVILLIAGVNYVNLTTALAARRLHEVSIRKVVGAQRFQLVRQFLGESLLLTFFALAMAVVLAYLFMPVFNILIQSDQSVELFQDLKLFTVLLTAALGIGLLSGVYPAVFMAGFAPSGTFKGALFTNTKKTLLRNMLVIVQFAISIFLIISTLVTSGQLHFIRNKKLGFSKDHILIVPLSDKNIKENLYAFKQDMLKNPGVNRVSVSTTIPMTIDWHNSFYYRNEEDPENNYIQSHYARVDYDFIDMFEMEIVKGRNFRKEIDEGRAAFIINEFIARKLGWEDPVGKAFHNQGRTGTIVGVVKDFHNENMHLPIGEVTLILAPDRGGLMSIKIDSEDVSKTLAAVEKVWNEFSGGYPFSYEFMDDRYDRMYKSEIRLGRAFNYFAVLAVFLCCLGLFGLASFTVEQGTKEIAVRKVLGASVSELVRLLSWKFMKWVLIANLIAWPVAYYVMSSWLRSFIYRIEIGWVIFVTAGAAAAVIAFLTVIARTAKAALSNPADSLRYE
jgi:putative ABC transport system permease protein